MQQNPFLDKARKPTPTLIAEKLGPTSKYWNELKGHFDPPVVEDWKHYGKKIGWSLKLLQGKRNVCFLTARDGFFIVSFIFGDKAVTAAKQSKLPTDLIEELVNSRKYAEGRGIRIEVKSKRHLEYVKTLAEIKINN